jgi:hypothetical protein
MTGITLTLRHGFVCVLYGKQWLESTEIEPELEEVCDQVPGEIKYGKMFLPDYHPPPIPPGPYTFVNLDKNEKV